MSLSKEQIESVLKDFNKRLDAIENALQSEPTPQPEPPVTMLYSPANCLRCVFYNICISHVQFHSPTCYYARKYFSESAQRLKVPNTCKECKLYNICSGRETALKGQKHCRLVLAVVQ